MKAPRRKVRGLSSASVLKRFTPNSRPRRIDEDFARRWVWWWRKLPDMVAQYEARAKAGGGSFQSTRREDAVAHFFRAYSQHVSFERFIDHLFDAELEHRINGGADWQHLPEKLLLPCPPSEYAEVKVAITLAANLSDKDASAKILQAYRKAQDAAGIRRVKLNRSNSIRSLRTDKSGCGWTRRFNVLELLDRWAWGWEPGTDELSQVRRLFRKRGLVRGW